jgi:hypothetical protein
MYFGSRDEICWWVPMLDGRPDGSSWIWYSDYAFRVGRPLGKTEFGRCFSRTIDEIHVRLVDQGDFCVGRLSRWLHIILSHGGAVELRYRWRIWSFFGLCNYLWLCLHLYMNPTGEGCSCWQAPITGPHRREHDDG